MTTTTSRPSSRPSRWLLLSATAVLAACAPPERRGHPGDGNGGAGGGGSGGQGGASEDAGGPRGADAPPPPSDKRCPNVIIVQDRSESMCADTGGKWGTCCSKGPSTSCPSKWKLAADAVAKVVGANQDRLRFGLVVYGGDDDFPGCGGAGRLRVAPEYGNAGAVSTAYASVKSWSGGTPTGATFAPDAKTPDSLAGNPDLASGDRPTYAILVTDGIPNCDTADSFTGKVSAANIAALAKRATAPIKTFVVGFGGSGLGLNDPCILSRMAQAGGMARPGCDPVPSSCDASGGPSAAPANPCYYDAADGAALEAALGDIVKSVGATVGGGCLR